MARFWILRIQVLVETDEEKNERQWTRANFFLFVFFHFSITLGIFCFLSFFCFCLCIFEWIDRFHLVIPLAWLYREKMVFTFVATFWIRFTFDDDDHWSRLNVCWFNRWSFFIPLTIANILIFPYYCVADRFDSNDYIVYEWWKTMISND